MRTRYGPVVYRDPNTSGKPIKVNYKGRGAIDAGAFYAPYIPLISIDRQLARKKANRNADSRRWWRRIFG